jgi:hypothetical protein
LKLVQEFVKHEGKNPSHDWLDAIKGDGENIAVVSTLRNLNHEALHVELSAGDC